MFEETSFLISGIVFGLTAGISPGPLLTLVISETLRTNSTAGIKVAVSPLVTDIPVVFVAFLILSRFSDFNHAMGLISISGSVFLGYLAYVNLFTDDVEFDTWDLKSQSLKKGVITNFLNPHPYLFWFTIGAPTVFKALGFDIYHAIAFLSGFYVCLVGSKILVAVITGKYSKFIESKTYVYIVKTLGLVLLLFAFKFLGDGLELLGMW
ncbi:MAG: LysE family transporter [Candidatus Methanoperedenaceae archaeon]|nr:LysE family transporter [Candidatus Methanoperedenaceae archaeon]